MFAASSVARAGTGCQAITRMRAHKMVRAPRQSATLPMGTPDLDWTAPLRKHIRMGDKSVRQTLAPQKASDRAGMAVLLDSRRQGVQIALATLELVHRTG